jgi:hypothetical protein
MRAAALVEALTEPGERFSSSSARELIALIPLNRGGRAPLQLDVGYTGPGSIVEGAAVGGGTAAAHREDDEKRWAFGQPVTWRCGLYKLDHDPGRLTIAQLFADTVEDDTGRQCRLIYNRRTGEPLTLELLVQQAVNLGPFRLALSRFRPWKRPA